MIAFLVAIAVQSFERTALKETAILAVVWAICVCFILLSISSEPVYRKFVENVIGRMKPSLNRLWAGITVGFGGRRGIDGCVCCQDISD